MINRRRFMEAGVAASLVATLAGAGLAPAESRGRAGDIAAGALPPGAPAVGREPSADLVRLHAAVVDQRFAAARRIGAALQRRGIPVHAFRGDVTDVWYARLYPLWKGSAAPIAGITAYAAMFCLEQLARDHGLRMIRRDPMHDEAAAKRDAAGAGPSLYAWVIAVPPGRPQPRPLRSL